MHPRFLLIGLVLFISCNQPVARKSERKADTTIPKITKKVIDTLPPEPDPAILRKRLFGFFERHKNENVFDTADDTYVAYWGAANYSDYSVKAGHLFNKKQVHCMILFSDYESTKMYIYYKKNEQWLKIFADTNLDARADPELKDWNRDGMRDISYRCERSWSYNYELWLVDKSGEQVHYVHGFDDVLNPEYDSLTGYLNSSYIHAGGGSFRRYRFSNYKIKEVDGVYVGDNYAAKSDPHIEVSFSRNGKEYKSLKTDYAHLPGYIPKRWKDDVQAYFGGP